MPVMAVLQMLEYSESCEKLTHTLIDNTYIKFKSSGKAEASPTKKRDNINKKYLDIHLLGEIYAIIDTATPLSIKSTYGN